MTSFWRLGQKSLKKIRWFFLGDLKTPKWHFENKWPLQFFYMKERNMKKKIAHVWLVLESETRPQITVIKKATTIMTSLFLRWSTLYLWLHIFSPNFVPIAVLLADFIAKIVLHIYWFHVFRNIKTWQIFEIVCGILWNTLSFCIGISIILTDEFLMNNSRIL